MLKGLLLLEFITTIPKRGTSKVEFITKKSWLEQALGGHEVTDQRRCVAGDETWIYQLDAENKIRSNEWYPKGTSGPVKFKA
nr:mariner transposase [Hymenolepis microstoma]